MSSFIAPIHEIRSRLSSVQFWWRLSVGMIVGHAAGALGFVAGSAVFSLPSASTGMEKAGGWYLLPLLFLITTMGLFSYALLLMIPISVLSSPAALVGAAILRTNRWWTMIIGAVVGVAVGWPTAKIVYPDLFGRDWSGLSRDWSGVACSAGAGALFSLSIWHFSIKPRLNLNGTTEARASANRRLSPLLIFSVVGLILLAIAVGG